MRYTQTDPDSRFDVLRLQLMPVSTPASMYEALPPGEEHLPAGHRKTPGSRAFLADTFVQRDETITLRDGIRLFADVYRPDAPGPVPAIMTWVPAGKQGRHDMTASTIPNDERAVRAEDLSGYQMWLGLDPALWTSYGYAIVNVDPRGCYNSEGDANYFGPGEAADGYDAIEWIAAQPWCDGRIGMAGNAYIAIEQWFIAASRPPHLRAIAPWEGHADFYREEFAVGGIPKPADPAMQRTFGAGTIEFASGMAEKRPLYDEYWESKRVDPAAIAVPTYAVSSYTNMNHARGTITMFRGLSTEAKWLRVHNSVETHDFRTDSAQHDLRRFFDRFLGGQDNGWDETPPVRYAVLDHGHTDTVDRPAADFPPPGVTMRRLLLGADGGLHLESEPIARGEASYGAGGDLTFRYVFDTLTELIGFPRLVLRMSVDGSGDADVFCALDKLDAAGDVVPANHLRDHPRHLAHTYSGPSTGRLRLSMRGAVSAPDDLVGTLPPFDVVRELEPGEAVDAEVTIPPIGLRFHPGEALQLRISPRDLAPAGSGLLALASRSGDENAVLHLGGEHPSYLLVPLLNPEEPT